ncbi:unnamed protein product [Caenorhabditis brenneri]
MTEARGADVTSDDLAKNVPVKFLRHIESTRKEGEKPIILHFIEDYLQLDTFKIKMKKGRDGLFSFEYIHVWVDEKNKTETKQTRDPETYITNLLKFMLKDPNGRFRIEMYGPTGAEYLLNMELMNRKIRELLDSFRHQIAFGAIDFKHLADDTFVTLMKRSKPGVLKSITFNIKWNGWEKLGGIVKMEAWKKATQIHSWGLTPLKFDDVKHCTHWRLHWETVTSSEIERIKEHIRDTDEEKFFTVFVEKGDMFRDETIKNKLKSKNTESCGEPWSGESYGYIHKWDHPRRTFEVKLTASSAVFNNIETIEPEQR